MKIAFKNGLKKGFGLPGFAMGSAMIGFGALAFESNLDFLVAIASMLFLWSMPAMILFVTLISSGASLILMFTSIFLANVRTLFMVLSAFLNMKVNSKNISFYDKIFWAQWVSPTGWTLIATNPDKISKDDLYSNFKGIAIGLVVMCFFGLSIGYFIFGNLSKELISIPILLAASAHFTYLFIALFLSFKYCFAYGPVNNSTRSALIFFAPSTIL